jgi:hypothetical protein
MVQGNRGPFCQLSQSVGRHLRTSSAYVEPHVLHVFPIFTKTVERLIQGYSRQPFGFVTTCQALHTTYVSRSYVKTYFLWLRHDIFGPRFD